VSEPSVQVQAPRDAVPAQKLLYLSLLLYGASLLTNVFTGLLGAVALAFGWMEALYFRREVGVWVAFAWFANPLIWGAWILIAQAAYRRALLLSALAVLLGLGLLTGTRIVISGSGTTMNLPTLSIGYWLWIASLAVALIGALIGLAGSRPQESGVMPAAPPAERARPE
jgi:hypothetical protein